MSPIDIAGLGLAQQASPRADVQAIAREFEALFLKLLWDSARMPAARTPEAAGGLFADLFLHELAASHALGFGQMVLQAFAQHDGGGKADGRQ